MYFICRVLFFIITILISVTISNEIYISNLGNDSTGNGTLLNPYKTFERILPIISDEALSFEIYFDGCSEYGGNYTMNNSTSNYLLLVSNRTLVFSTYNIGAVSINVTLQYYLSSASVIFNNMQLVYLEFEAPPFDFNLEFNSSLVMNSVSYIKLSYTSQTIRAFNESLIILNSSKIYFMDLIVTGSSKVLVENNTMLNSFQLEPLYSSELIIRNKKEVICYDIYMPTIINSTISIDNSILDQFLFGLTTDNRNNTLNILNSLLSQNELKYKFHNFKIFLGAWSNITILNSIIFDIPNAPNIFKLSSMTRLSIKNSIFQSINILYSFISSIESYIEIDMVQFRDVQANSFITTTYDYRISLNEIYCTSPCEFGLIQAPTPMYLEISNSLIQYPVGSAKSLIIMGSPDYLSRSSIIIYGTTISNSDTLIFKQSDIKFQDVKISNFGGNIIHLMAMSFLHANECFYQSNNYIQSSFILIMENSFANLTNSEIYQSASSFTGISSLLYLKNFNITSSYSQRSNIHFISSEINIENLRYIDCVVSPSISYDVTSLPSFTFQKSKLILNDLYISNTFSGDALFLLNQCNMMIQGFDFHDSTLMNTDAIFIENSTLSLLDVHISNITAPTSLFVLAKANSSFYIENGRVDSSYFLFFIFDEMGSQISINSIEFQRNEFTILYSSGSSLLSIKDVKLVQNSVLYSMITIRNCQNFTMSGLSLINTNGVSTLVDAWDSVLSFDNIIVSYNSYQPLGKSVLEFYKCSSILRDFIFLNNDDFDQLIYSSYGSSLYISNLSVIGNTLQDSVYTYNTSNITIEKTEFINNTLSSCIWLRYPEVFLVQNSKFYNSLAKGNGAVRITNPLGEGTFHSNEFYNNSASFGGAIAIMDDFGKLFNCSFSNNSFILNSASNSGGAVYSINKLSLTESYFENNTALYGNDYATAPYSIYATYPDSIQTNQIFKFEISLRDAYFNIVELPEIVLLTIAIKSPKGNDSDIFFHEMTSSISSFEYKFKEQSVGECYTVRIQPVDYHINLTLSIPISPCYQYQYWNIDHCVYCELGFAYSKTREHCEKCNEHASCFNEQVIVSSGYDIINNDMYYFYQCQPNLCMESTNCTSPNTGILCGECTSDLPSKTSIYCCFKTSPWILPSYIIFLLIFSIFISYYKYSIIYSRTNTIKRLLVYLQFISIIFYPTPQLYLIPLFRFSIDFIFQVCPYSDITVHHKFIISITSIAIVFLIGTSDLPMKLYFRWRNGSNHILSSNQKRYLKYSKIQNNISTTFLALFNIFYPSLIFNLLEMVICKNIAGTEYLSIDQTLGCFKYGVSKLQFIFGIGSIILLFLIAIILPMKYLITYLKLSKRIPNQYDFNSIMIIYYLDTIKSIVIPFISIQLIYDRDLYFPVIKLILLASLAVNYIADLSKYSKYHYHFENFSNLLLLALIMLSELNQLAVSYNQVNQIFEILLIYISIVLIILFKKFYIKFYL